MANENMKDFNAMMNDKKDMPKVQVVQDEKNIEKYGGTKMLFAPPSFYDYLMKKVPKGKLITVTQMRDFLAKQNHADFTDPLTAGIFVNIVAWASYQRNEDITPYWRTLKPDGELNAKYPKGIELQKRLLEEEGHIIISKGRKNIKYYVKDFENSLVELSSNKDKNNSKFEIICDKYLYFGSYPQNGTEKEPILWRILKKENNIATLITDKILINSLYAEYFNDYKISAVRKFIHEEFIPVAFTPDELEMILPTELESVTDKVFIPSFDDIKDLSRAERIRKVTPFARSNEASSYPDYSKEFAGNGWYWTRSPWRPPYNPRNNHELLYVEYYGGISFKVPNGFDIGVVPLIRIKIDE